MKRVADRAAMAENTSRGFALVLLFVILIGVIIAFSRTFITTIAGADTGTTTIALLVALALPLVLLGVTVFQITRLLRQRALRQSGAGLRLRLLLFFALVSILSAGPQAMLGITFVNSAMGTWFSSSIGDALRGARAGYAGEFYTQRHIIRAMVEVVRPQAGERVYDPCFGTAGFLGEAADFVRRHGNLSTAQLDKLQNGTFYGLELKPLTYLLGSMNMILHGVEGANLELANTLEVHSQNVAERDKYKVILANPPYGGKMAQELQTNFRVHSSATECLFLQHIMANLSKGGRAAVIVPEGVLFRGGPDQKVRKELLEQFRVHTILSLPAGCFLPYTGVKTNVLFFDRTAEGAGTDSVWYYELTNDGFELKQTRKPIQGGQFPDFLAKWRKRTAGENSWTVPLADIVARGFDLSARNPNKTNDYEHRPALELVQSIKAKEVRIADLLDELESLLEGGA